MAARKRPFDIHVVLRRIREAVAQYPDAAMFALRDEGYGTLFQQLVACIISIRTTDEVSLPVALALLKRAPTPAAMARMTVSDIDAIIHAASFHGPKARQIHELAQRATEEFGGELPCDADVLRSFAGVGPKCANLALGEDLLTLFGDILGRQRGGRMLHHRSPDVAFERQCC